MNRELVLDGNAVGGILLDLFGVEMTTVPSECANCGNVAEMIRLLTEEKHAIKVYVEVRDVG